MVRFVAATLLATLALTCAAAAAASYPHTFGPVKRNPADSLVKLPIDSFRYDYARHCTTRPTPGALAMVSWLEDHSNGVFWGIMRCEKFGPHNYSLHSDGRAIDWHLDGRVRGLRPSRGRPHGRALRNRRTTRLRARRPPWRKFAPRHTHALERHRRERQPLRRRLRGGRSRRLDLT